PPRWWAGQLPCQDCGSNPASNQNGRAAWRSSLFMTGSVRLRAPRSAHAAGSPASGYPARQPVPEGDRASRWRCSARRRALERVISSASRTSVCSDRPRHAEARMSGESARKLVGLAELARTPGRQVSSMPIAALLLEEAAAQRPVGPPQGSAPAPLDAGRALAHRVVKREALCQNWVRLRACTLSPVA